jgi:predicted hydrocarbon binding protein
MVFREERTELLFDWSMLGDVKLGRPNLGPTTSVAAYRLMQFTLRDAMIRDFGAEATTRIFYLAGENAGRQVARNVLSPETDFGKFMNKLEELFIELGIGVLRVEKADLENQEFTVTVSEDIDCSGLPICDETICTFDEGFFSGLLSEFAGCGFSSREIDCWCSGGRVCRFEVKATS